MQKHLLAIISAAAFLATMTSVINAGTLRTENLYVTNTQAQGGGTADGLYSTSEGASSSAIGVRSHAEGFGTFAYGTNSHAEGQSCIATGNNSHAEGGATKALGLQSHSEGWSSTAGGTASHAEGYNTEAGGNYSHAEGQGSIAYSLRAHAEGYNTIASNNQAHAEGNATKAYGNASHAEGTSTLADGNSSHAQGYTTEALADYSHAGGIYSRVLAGHTNAFIHAAGSGTNSMKETAFPNTAHFDRLHLMESANDNPSSVLSRAENDLRYASSNQGVLASTALQSDSPTAQVTFSNIMANGVIAGNGAGITNIGGAGIVAGSIGTAHLADNAVSEGKIAADAVTSAKIADSSVTSNKIAAGAINVSKLDPSVDARYLSSSVNAVTNMTAASTDQALARFDGTTGRRVEDSKIRVDDDGRLVVDTITNLVVRSTEMEGYGAYIEIENTYAESWAGFKIWVDGVLHGYLCGGPAAEEYGCVDGLTIEPGETNQALGFTTGERIVGVGNHVGPSMILTPEGRLGVGTNSPAELLHVNGNLKAVAGIFAGALTLPTDGITAGGSQLVLDGGNVGIGTATPTNKLEVAGTMKVTGQALLLYVPPQGDLLMGSYTNGLPN